MARWCSGYGVGFALESRDRGFDSQPLAFEWLTLCKPLTHVCFRFQAGKLVPTQARRQRGTLYNALARVHDLVASAAAWKRAIGLEINQVDSYKQKAITTSLNHKL